MAVGAYAARVPGTRAERIVLALYGVWALLPVVYLLHRAGGGELSGAQGLYPADQLQRVFEPGLECPQVAVVDADQRRPARQYARQLLGVV